MSIRLYADSFRCAIYEEASGGGDPVDPTSPMNRPVIDPFNWIPNLYFHSDLDYYEIAAKNLNCVISHAAVAGRVTQAGGTGEVSAVVSLAGQFVRTSHTMVTHNLGYPPRFFCIYNGQLIPHGMPVQNAGGGLVRFVTAYATNTEIRLGELAVSTASALPAANITYQVIVFRTPGTDPSSKMLDIYPGAADFGQGKFRASEPHLRADGLGDVQWPIATARTAGVRNGGLRTYYPTGGFVDFGPYNGSLSAPPYIITSAGV